MNHRLSLSTLILLCLLFSCRQESKNPKSTESSRNAGLQIPENQSSDRFNQYWYQGKAELNAYDLQQARYGELRRGEAVLIFVTEDFLIDSQVKKEREVKEAGTSVLKLNFLRKFTTGIYDYSMMNSVFQPIHQNQFLPPLKMTTSSQDWCGHSWMQLNRNSSGFDLKLFSYFQAEGDQSIQLDDEVLIEDAFWNQLRINPDQIPKGERMVLPGSHYFRFSHRELKPYQAVITVEKAPRKNYPNTKSFSVNYPELDRLLTIFYQADFPHQIIAWEERRASGFGDSAKRMTTTATLKSDVKTSYWSQNKTEDASWRDSLKLNH